MDNNQKIFTEDRTFLDNYCNYTGSSTEDFSLTCLKDGKFRFEGKTESSSYNDTWGDSGSYTKLNYEGTYNITKEDSEILLISLHAEQYTMIEGSYGYTGDNNTNTTKNDKKTILFTSIKWANKHGFSNNLNTEPMNEGVYCRFYEIVFDENKFIMNCLAKLEISEFNQNALDSLKKNKGNIESTFAELYPDVIEKKRLILEAIPNQFHPNTPYVDYLSKLNSILIKRKLDVIKSLEEMHSYNFEILVDFEEWCKSTLNINDQIEIIKLYYLSYHTYGEIVEPKMFLSRKKDLHQEYTNLVNYYKLNVPFGEFTEEKIIDKLFYYFYRQKMHYEIFVIYEITNDKILAFKKFIEKFSDEELRRRATFASYHFTPKEINYFRDDYLETLEIIISNQETFNAFKYIFVLLLDPNFTGYYKLNDYLDSYLESGNNPLELTFKKVCYTDYYDKYTNELQLPLTKEQHILMSRCQYEFVDIQLNILIPDFKKFVGKDLSEKEAIEIFSEIALNPNISRYSEHYEEEKKREIAKAIDLYYFNTRKLYLENSEVLKQKYPTSTKHSSNFVFYLMIKFSGDVQQVENYLTNKVN